MGTPHCGSDDPYCNVIAGCECRHDRARLAARRPSPSRRSINRYEVRSRDAAMYAIILLRTHLGCLCLGSRLTRIYRFVTTKEEDIPRVLPAYCLAHLESEARTSHSRWVPAWLSLNLTYPIPGDQLSYQGTNRGKIPGSQQTRSAMFPHC